MNRIFVLLILLTQSIVIGQTSTAKLFEPAQIKADIDTLIFTLIKVHPTFQNYYQDNNIQNKIDSIKNNITTHLSSIDLFRIMQPLVNIDGHTTLTYNGEIYPKVENPFFPFKVIIYNNTLYVRENLSEYKSISRGSIIEKINGISSSQVLNNLIKYLPGEKFTYKTKSLEKEFHLYYWLVYGSYAEFNISVNESEMKLKGAKWTDYLEPTKPKFELRFYDNDIAYIYKRSFKPPKDFVHFVDSAFNAIADKQIKYLIIDNLNGGGLTDLADSLIGYFTNEPFRLIEKKMTRISPLTKDYIDSKKSEGYIEDGYFVQEFPANNIVRNNQFTGLTYILTGPLSYSTATCFSASAKCYKSALIVGEETGQPLFSNGDLNRFILPNTQIMCYTSLSKIFMPCNDNDTMKGVLPDYYVKPSLDDLLNNSDYTLDYALKLIREKKDKE